MRGRIATTAGLALVMVVVWGYLPGPRAQAPGRHQAVAPPAVPEDWREGLVRLAAEIRARTNEAERLGEEAADQAVEADRAQAELKTAERTLGVANIAVQEYLDGIFPAEMEALRAKQTIAEGERSRAEDEFAASDKEARKAKQDQSLQARRDAQAQVRAAEMNLRSAANQIQLLQKYSKELRKAELEAAVDRARSDMLVKKTLSDRERGKAVRLKRQAALGAVTKAEQKAADAMEETFALEALWEAARDEKKAAAEPNDLARKAREKFDEAHRLWLDARVARARIGLSGKPE